MIGVIGGTGLYRLADLQTREVAPPETPFGPASSHIAIGSLRGPGSPEVAFLARHGADHRLAPHQVPCRANIWALREAGVNEIVAVNSVGSLQIGRAHV